MTLAHPHKPRPKPTRQLLEQLHTALTHQQLDDLTSSGRVAEERAPRPCAACCVPSWVRRGALCERCCGLLLLAIEQLHASLLDPKPPAP